MELIKTTLPTGAGLTCWLHSKAAGLNAEACEYRPTLILCPGGGYWGISDCENDPVATEFFAMGLHVLVLSYGVQEQAANKRPLEDAAWAILTARQNKDAWGIDPDRVAIMGFSAGGHVAGSLAVHWNDPEIARRLGVEDSRVLRPNGAVLCYPVLTAQEGLRNEGSIQRVSAGGGDPDYWSLEKHVTADTPPTFLWHTMEDKAVPVENSLMFAAAMRRNRASCEAHFFPFGPHALTVCTAETGRPRPTVRPWVDLCHTWLESTLGPLPA